MPLNTRLAYLLNEKSDLSIRSRCKLLSINRSRVYYKALPEKPEDIQLKEKIYKIWEDRNNKGSRIIAKELWRI